MDLLARDVMERNVAVVAAQATLLELEQAFEEAGVSGFPVVDGGRVVGVVSRADVLRQLGGKSGDEPRLSTFYAELPSFGSGLADERFADAAARGGRPVEQLKVADLMTPSTVTVAPDATLLDVALALTEHRIHRVLVTDAGTLVGVVSSLDLVRLVAEEKLAVVTPRPRGVGSHD
ncbi:MAG: CBS domain-containing protein [Myxococcota bacterium]|nr:CBS domain-containing protein [Myxococcota bacterium]